MLSFRFLCFRIFKKKNLFIFYISVYYILHFVDRHFMNIIVAFFLFAVQCFPPAFLTFSWIWFGQIILPLLWNKHSNCLKTRWIFFFFNLHRKYIFFYKNAMTAQLIIELQKYQMRNKWTPPFWCSMQFLCTLKFAK